MDKQINTLTLSIIQREIAGHLTQFQFLESIFPLFLKEKNGSDLLYFIFEKEANPRTRSIFMNGNCNKKKNTFTRFQVKALEFIANMLKKKKYVFQWIEFLKTNYPDLKEDDIRNIAKKDEKNYIDGFRELVFHENDPYYLLLYILCWSFFGEQINRCEFKLSSEYTSEEKELVFLDDESFFNFMFSEREKIECIEMAYHSGYKWLYDTKRATMLTDYLSNSGKLRVIVNSTDAAEIVAPYLRNPNKRYVGFEQSIDAWTWLATKYSDFVELVVSEIPLLHSYINFHAKDNAYSKMLIIFYTYGNPNFLQNHPLLNIFYSKKNLIIYGKMELIFQDNLKKR